MIDHPEKIVGLAWRNADILAKTERLLALNTWIDHTEDLVEMLSEDESFTGELRAVAGAVRTKRNDINREIDILNAEIMTRDMPSNPEVS